MKAVVFIALLLVGSFGAEGTKRRGHANLYRMYEATLPKLQVFREGETYWFDQRLDHFDSQNTATFKQRYYVNDTYYVKGGPLFVYIGGEAALGANSITSGEIVENAMEHKAMMVALEHRYYGKSHPFPTLSTANLKYLSSQQALADLANFIEFFRYNSSLPESKTITFGGSYPGALSAWFRSKYPHITAGSVASSAPILAKADFFEYDETVSASAGPTCSAAVRAATADVQNQLFKDDQAANDLKKLFTCEKVEDNMSFLYVLADAVAYAIQYTSTTPGPRYNLRGKLCDTLEDNSKDSITQYAAFVTGLFEALQTPCEHFTSTDTVLSDPTVAEELNQRQWWYQSCTEFGFFQTAPAKDPVRSPLINLQYHYDLCEKAFGVALRPRLEFTNEYYGALKIVGSNIFFPNGSLDPWKRLSLREPRACCDSIIPLEINGTAHCADLYANRPEDPQSLTEARGQIAKAIRQWLAEP
eukprot:Colp12_sorted_trinity150504_noHs@24662